MSLLRYFHKEPKETVSHVSNVSATECALSVVEQQNINDNLASISQADITSKRKRPRPEKYKTTDSTQRWEIANHAIRHGFRPTAKKFGVAESTVRSYVKLLKDQPLPIQGRDAKDQIIPYRKRGAKTLLPGEIDSKVIQVVTNLRLNGAVVNYNVLVAIAKGIVTATDRTLLSENGGNISLSWKWCESVFRRMNFVNRKATTAKATIAPGLIREVGLTFFNEIFETVKAHNIPPALIINIDQTPLPYVLISQ